VQAFSISNNQFGYYNDCVGFFNITIWCVLIVLFVLFIILADGVCMMMSLETCDRTDDPKGKTITIIASE
jgi:V-type H+-transporting ATPase S1 subunit